MIELMFMGSAAFVGGAHAVRQTRARHRPHGRPRDSLLVKAWNSAGAPATRERQLPDALADLTGRAIGKGSRAAWRRGQRHNAVLNEAVGEVGNRAFQGGRRGTARMRSWAERRWQRRTGTPEQQQPSPETPAELPRGHQQQPLPAGPRPLPLPAGAAGAPASPIPMPAAAHQTPAAPSGNGRKAGRNNGWQSSGRGAGQGTARPARRARRAYPRMQISGPLELSVPGTDAEFLETCQHLQQMLRGVGVAVEDWADELSIRRMPPIITRPLIEVHEGLVDGVACTALASVLFEAWFAEAREIAAAGIEFTGEDTP